MSNSITINSNLASLNAQRRLGQSTSALQTSFTRLSSGLRINKASDDAAGLAIAASLDVDQRVYTQGVRNLNDAISLLNIADGAVSELSNILIRLAELAETASNGTYSDAQRETLDEEADTLVNEYNRIIAAVEFNGLTLLDGSTGPIAAQAGYDQLSFTLGENLRANTVGDGTFGFGSSFSVEPGGSIYDLTLGDVDGDGKLDLVRTHYGPHSISVLIGSGDGSFAAPVSYQYQVGSDPFTGLELADFDGNGSLDIAAADDNSLVTVFLNNGNGTFKTPVPSNGSGASDLAIGDFDGNGTADIVVSGDSGMTNRVAVVLGNGNGTFKSRVYYSAGPTPGPTPTSVATGDIDGNGTLDFLVGEIFSTSGMSVVFGNGDGSFQAPVTILTSAVNSVELVDLDNDGKLDVLGWNGSTLSVQLGNGNGTFSPVFTASSSATPKIGDFNGDTVIDLVGTEGSTALVYLGNGDGTYKAALSSPQASGILSAIGDIDDDGVLDVAYASTALLGNSVTTGGLRPLDLRTQSGAQETLDLVKEQIAAVSSERANIGAAVSRLTVATNTLRVSSENYQAAASQIRDADVAWESAKLVRNNILQQAGAAVLAQANQAPALALTLLG